MQMKGVIAPNRLAWVILIAVLSVGFILRVAAFVRLLPGLNQDEASTGYEAFSLFNTGYDRWGIHFLPVYLIAWGSGQNALPSYLIAPVVGFFGISTFTIRILPFLMQLSVLLFFFAYLRVVYSKYGRRLALVGLLLLALCPWHIMVSAWTLESNLAPVFLMLGALLFENASAEATQTLIPKQDSRRLTVLVISASALALSLYCYLAVLPVVLFMVLGFTVRLNAQFSQRGFLYFSRETMIYASSFLLISMPILFFVIKNHIIRSETSLDLLLPFSVPLLLTSRLTQISKAFSVTLSQNWDFAVHGFKDGLIWNHIPGNHPIQVGLLLCAILGIAKCLVGLLRNIMRGKFLPTALGLQLMGSIFVFFLVPLNINRINSIWLPLLCYSTVGMFEAFPVSYFLLDSRCRETRKGLFHKPFREFFSSGACLTSEVG